MDVYKERIFKCQNVYMYLTFDFYNEQIYRNNGLEHWEQKTKIISDFIGIIGSGLMDTKNL